MRQLVYILELRRGETYARVHFAQTEGAARRAVVKYRLSGIWTAGEAPIISELRDGDTPLARIVRESVEYS